MIEWLIRLWHGDGWREHYNGREFVMRRRVGGVWETRTMTDGEDRELQWWQIK